MTADPISTGVLSTWLWANSSTVVPAGAVPANVGVASLVWMPSPLVTPLSLAGVRAPERRTVAIRVWAAFWTWALKAGSVRVAASDPAAAAAFWATKSAWISGVDILELGVAGRELLEGADEAGRQASAGDHRLEVLDVGRRDRHVRHAAGLERGLDVGLQARLGCRDGPKLLGELRHRRKLHLLVSRVGRVGGRRLRHYRAPC